MSECKVIAIYPQGMPKTTIVEGQYYGTKIKVFSHKCYFDRYKINDRYYWFYDEEKIYHIEDSETGKVVFVAIGNCPQDIIDEFLKTKEVML